MTSRVLPALLVLLTLAPLGFGREAVAGPRKKTIDTPYPPQFQARVRKAIERGVTYLRTEQMADLSASPREVQDSLEGVEFEEAAAVIWVLKRAGVAADDAAFVKARKRLDRRAPKSVEEAGLVLLALCTESLAEGNPFSIEASAPGTPPSLSKEDRGLVERTVKFVLERQVTTVFAGGSLERRYDARGGWGADLGRLSSLDSSDIPTTYSALLGLEAAARIGVTVPASHHMAALGLLVGWQAPKGPAVLLGMNEVRGRDRFEWTEKAQARGFSWAGTMSDTPSGYETVAGALGLAICQDALQNERGFDEALRTSVREGIRDALAWLQQNYDITKNPVLGGGNRRSVEGALYHHHWLQGLARIAIHARMRFVGNHDWYREGADVLLKTQEEDGSWQAIWWSNCYSLLFLLRASLRSIVPVVTPSEQDPGK